MRLVVDSSVIIKWLNTTNEADIDKANKVLQDALDGKIELFTPELAKYEVANVLLYSKQLAPNKASFSLETIRALPLTFVAESLELANETYSLAYKLKITYYDASFLSLAKQLKATLITDNIKHQGKSKTIKVIALSEYN